MVESKRAASRLIAPFLLSAVAIALALAATGAHAASERDAPRFATLFVRGDDGVARPAVALSTDVDIQISGLVARARVRQQFSNESDLWLEGVYVFPLPEMAAVDRLVLEVGERRIEGRIRERAEAKRTYEQAKSEGKTASLLEQERPNLFTTSVANIGPGERVDITIEYQLALDFERDGFELRFPMTLTTRYIPGGSDAGDAPPAPEDLTAPDGGGWSRATPAVPDAPRITPWFHHPASPVVNPLTLRVELDSGFPLDELWSPSHDVDIVEFEETVHEVWIDGVPADRDFVLRWKPERGSEPRAAIFSEERDGQHYALVMLLPPAAETGAPRIPREAVFVIDTSGSMGGASLEQARAALHLALERLAPDDTFNVIAFDDAPRAVFGASVAASAANVARAQRFVDGLRASGGTEMLAALRRALRDPGDAAGRLRQVVFITDGSIGNEAQLFGAIQRELGRSRLFMVGIGSAPNAYFLNRAATFGRGTATSIGSQAEVQERMAALFAKIESPVLGDLEVHWNDEVEMWPERVPDLYAGEPVLVTARLARFVGEVRLKGRRGEEPFEVRLPLTRGAPERGIHKLWARRKIAHWMSRGVAGASADEVRAQVLAVALEHELVSRFTSLVAVDVTPRRPAGAPGAGTGVPNHGPAGFDPDLVPGVLPRTATPAPLLLWMGAASLLAAGGLWRGGRRRA